MQVFIVDAPAEEGIARAGRTFRSEDAAIAFHRDFKIAERRAVVVFKRGAVGDRRIDGIHFDGDHFSALRSVRFKF